MAGERARAGRPAAAGQARERAVEPPPVLRAGAGGATIAQMVVGLAPAGHGNGEHARLELRSAMATRR